MNLLFTNLFLWPWVLLTLLLTPLLVWSYRRELRPPAKTAVLYPDLERLLKLAPPSNPLRKHWPALLYLLAAVLGVVALARPTVPVPEAHPQAGIILALDVSRSMDNSDVAPNRFEAARTALRAFVGTLPAGARVGLVTFSGYATLTVPLTDNREQLLTAVDRLSLGYGTAIGDAMITSLDALPTLEARQALGKPEDFATVILLSDGRNRDGPEPEEVLPLVKAAHVVVHTIGVGTDSGSAPSDPYSRYGSAGRFDEATLRAIAEGTGGRYVFVESAEALKNVYRELSRGLVWRVRRDDATALGALAAGVILALSLVGGAFRRRIV